MVAGGTPPGSLPAGCSRPWNAATTQPRRRCARNIRRVTGTQRFESGFRTDANLDRFIHNTNWLDVDPRFVCKRIGAVQWWTDPLEACGSGYRRCWPPTAVSVAPNRNNGWSRKRRILCSPNGRILASAESIGASMPSRRQVLAGIPKLVTPCHLPRPLPCPRTGAQGAQGTAEGPAGEQGAPAFSGRLIGPRGQGWRSRWREVTRTQSQERRGHLSAGRQGCEMDPVVAKSNWMPS